MIRADALNSHGYLVRTKMTAPFFHIVSTDEDELKGLIANKNFTTDFFYRRGQIKRHHLQQNFITELFQG